MERRKLVFDNSFLSKRGKIFIDTCGPKWMPRGCTSEQRISRLKNFNVFLKERGGIFTSPLIFNEIVGNAKYFFGEIRKAERLMKMYLARHGKDADVSKLYESIHRNFIGGYENFKLFNMLEVVDIPKRAQRGGLSYFEIREFYEDFDIQSPDRELVSTLTFSGSGNGVLTADSGIMRAFRSGARRFSLDGFICNSMDCRVERVEGNRRIYACA